MTTIEEEVRAFCRNTPRLHKESGIVFAERLRQALTRTRLSTLNEVDAMLSKIDTDSDFGLDYAIAGVRKMLLEDSLLTSDKTKT